MENRIGVSAILFILRLFSALIDGAIPVTDDIISKKTLINACQITQRTIAQSASLNFCTLKTKQVRKSTLFPFKKILNDLHTYSFIT